MERNIDRNLRMAKREARYFLGLSGRRLEVGAFIFTLLLFVGAALCLPDEPAQLLEGPKGWLLLTGIVLVIAALSYVSVRGLPFDWSRPRQAVRKRPEGPRYRRWPRGRT